MGGRVEPGHRLFELVLAYLEAGDLAPGDLFDLAALDTDVAQLAIGELLELIDGLEALKAFAEPGKSLLEEGGQDGLAGAAKGETG